MTRLVQIVLINNTRAGIDDLAARAGNRVDARGTTFTSWAHLPLSRLSLIHIIGLQLRLRCPLYNLVIDTIEAAFLQACRPLVHLHLALRCRAFIEQVVGAGLRILGELMLVAVDVLARAPDDH